MIKINWWPASGFGYHIFATSVSILIFHLEIIGELILLVLCLILQPVSNKFIYSDTVS